MFCKNCGASISEGAKFCSKCGTKVTEATAVVQKVTATPAPEESVKTKKKSGSKIKGILISAISLGVLAIVTVAVVIVLGILNNNDGGSNSGGRSGDENEDNGNSYEQEIKDYLDYLAEKNDDVMDFITDAYVGGQFGTMYSGKEADKIHEIMLEVEFDELQASNSLSHYYGYYDYSSYDSWEKLLEDEGIAELYYDIKSNYGNDWSLEYKIGDAEELSESKLEKLQEIFEDAIIDDFYGTEMEFDSKKDREKVEEFVEFLEELEVEEAYKVEVEITIEGKKDDYEDEVDFVVAKIGKQWVIMEGPAYYNLIYR